MSELEHYDAKSRHWAVLVAFANSELSEGEASKVLGVDRITLREHVEDALKAATELAVRFRDSGETVGDDFVNEAARRQRVRRCDD